jgi:hypothetical protein
MMRSENLEFAVAQGVSVEAEAWGGAKTLSEPFLISDPQPLTSKPLTLCMELPLLP